MARDRLAPGHVGVRLSGFLSSFLSVCGVHQRYLVNLSLVFTGFSEVLKPPLKNLSGPILNSQPHPPQTHPAHVRSRIFVRCLIFLLPMIFLKGKPKLTSATVINKFSEKDKAIALAPNLPENAHRSCQRVDLEGLGMIVQCFNKVPRTLFSLTPTVSKMQPNSLPKRVEFGFWPSFN